MAAHTLISTTAWLASDPSSDLAALLQQIGHHWQVEVQLGVASLRFSSCSHPGLRDYERGYVKEGVGAGALAWVWEQSGRTPQDLAAACDLAAAQLLRQGAQG